MGLIQRVKMWWNRPSDAVTIASLAQQVYDNDRTSATIFDYIQGELRFQDKMIDESAERIEIGSQNIANLFQTVNGQSRSFEDTSKRMKSLYDDQVIKLNCYFENLQRRIDAHEKDCLDYDVVIQGMEDDITESKAVIERQQKQIDKLAATVDTLAKEAFHRVSSPYDPLPPMGVPRKRKGTTGEILDPPKQVRRNPSDAKSWVADNSKSAVAERMINGPKITMKKGAKSK